jgi:hypothetical protein
MKSILLLAALAAATLAIDQPEIPAGETVLDVPDDIADQLIADGKAQLTGPAAPAARSRLVKARVLVAGQHGKPNDVVTVTAAVARASNELDADAEAVAYAESLAAQ